jgi:hypothetical protein
MLSARHLRSLVPGKTVRDLSKPLASSALFLRVSLSTTLHTSRLMDSDHRLLGQLRARFDVKIFCLADAFDTSVACDFLSRKCPQFERHLWTNLPGCGNAIFHGFRLGFVVRSAISWAR